LDILLNGASTGNTHAAEPPSTFTYFAPFTISTGFVPGTNTLDFVVHNAPLPFNPSVNPTGLQVTLGGTAEPVPEPSSLSLLGIGAVGVFAIRRKARISTQAQSQIVQPLKELLLRLDLLGLRERPLQHARCDPPHLVNV